MQIGLIIDKTSKNRA